MIRPPFSRESAMQLTRLTTEAWNATNPDNLLALLNDEIVWSENGIELKSKSEISEALHKKWKNSLHFNHNQTLHSFEHNCVSMSFKSEWQDSRYGYWLQKGGISEINFCTDGFIRTINTVCNIREINSSERTFPLTRKINEGITL